MADNGTVRRVNISDLLPDRANANLHSERGTYMVSRSLEKLGAGRSILIDRDGEIIAGNLTAEQAADMGLTEVLVVETDGSQLVAVQRTDMDLDDPATGAREMAYADNRAAVVSIDFDPDVISADLEAGLDLGDWWQDFELEEIGAIEPSPPEDVPPQVDRAEELREKWQVESGQLWQLGDHRVICGDCTDGAVVDRVMGGEKADMVFTDPPYNVASESRNYAADTSKAMNDLKNADWDNDFDIVVLFPVLDSVIATDCAVYICTSQWLVQQVWEWMWSWSDFCSYNVWCKPNPMPSLSKRHWTWATELIPYAVRGRHVSNFPDGKHALNWWDIAKDKETDHPTEKVLEVPARAIRFSSKTGQVVFDGFVGSGTTLIACERLGRKCYGVEIEPKYVAVTLQRWADVTGQEPVLIS